MGILTADWRRVDRRQRGGVCGPQSHGCCKVQCRGSFGQWSHPEQLDDRASVFRLVSTPNFSNHFFVRRQGHCDSLCRFKGLSHRIITLWLLFIYKPTQVLVLRGIFTHFISFLTTAQKKQLDFHPTRTRPRLASTKKKTIETFFP